MLLRISIILLLVTQGWAQRGSKGLFEDAENIWSHINTGIDQFQVSAARDLAKLKPWAQQVEEEMKPALSQVEEHLGSAFNQMAEHLDFASDRVDEPEVVETSPNADPPMKIHPLHQLLGGLHRGPMNPFRIFGISSRKWWDGPNVCVERQVIEEDKEAEEKSEDGEAASNPGIAIHMDMTLTTCRDGDNFHECTTKVSTNGNKKTVVVKHECCFGYRRKGNEFGCNQELTDNLTETIKELKGDEFLQLLKATNLESMLKENMTVFVPTDDAVEDFRHDLEKMNALDHDEISYEINEANDEQPAEISEGILYRRKKRNSEISIVEAPSMTSILKNHFIDGWVDTSDMHDNDKARTRNGAENANLKFTVYNTYPEKTVMANCAKIVSRNNFATNGVVHLVDKVILPASKSVGEILQADSQFQSFSSALINANLMEKLGQTDQRVTVFAPVDGAFNKMPEALKQKVKAGNGCSQDILNAHILSNFVCSGAIETKAKAVNDLNQYVNLERNEENELLIEGIKVVLKDIVGSNGVIHVIEDVIIPESARSLIETLEANHAPTFAELFKLAGLEGSNEFDNATIFAPKESALVSLPKSYLDDLKADPKKLREFLMYHVVKPKTCKCDFENNKILPTGIEGKNLRLNVHQSSPFGLIDVPRKVATVQCARLTRLDDEICGGLIHTVEKVLLPPEGNLIQVLKNNNQFKTFNELLSFSEVESELSGEGPLTILAPTDSAFTHLSEEMREELFGDKELAAKVVKQHMIRDSVCCTSIPRVMPFFDMSGRRAASGDVVSLRKSAGGHIYANRAEIITCDMMADNGVIHAVDRLIDLDTATEDVEQIVSQTRTRPFNIFELF